MRFCYFYTIRLLQIYTPYPKNPILSIFVYSCNTQNLLFQRAFGSMVFFYTPHFVATKSMLAKIYPHSLKLNTLAILSGWKNILISWNTFKHLIGIKEWQRFYCYDVTLCLKWRHISSLWPHKCDREYKMTSYSDKWCPCDVNSLSKRRQSSNFTLW